MFSDIYSHPDWSQTVKFDPKDQGDKAEHEETEVCVEEAEDDIVANPMLSELQEGERQTPIQPGVKKQPARAATLCKGLLCFVMLAVIVTLTTSLTLEINELNDKQNQLLVTLLDLTVNTSQLQSSYDRLNQNHTQLLHRVMQQKQTLEGLKCPKGWTRFGCKLYFKSTEKKTWTDSRKHCQENGADLVILNAKEEQKFITDFTVWESWIGLRRTAGDNWKWVDGSPLVESSWLTKPSPFKKEDHNSASITIQGKLAAAAAEFSLKNWICEK